MSACATGTHTSRTSWRRCAPTASSPSAHCALRRRTPAPAPGCIVEPPRPRPPECRWSSSPAGATIRCSRRRSPRGCGRSGRRPVRWQAGVSLSCSRHTQSLAALSCTPTPMHRRLAGPAPRRLPTASRPTMPVPPRTLTQSSASVPPWLSPAPSRPWACPMTTGSSPSRARASPARPGSGRPSKIP